MSQVNSDGWSLTSCSLRVCLSAVLLCFEVRSSVPRAHVCVHMV